MDYSEGLDDGYHRGIARGRAMQLLEEHQHQWARLTWTVIACSFIGCLLSLCAGGAIIVSIWL